MRLTMRRAAMAACLGAVVSFATLLTCFLRAKFRRKAHAGSRQRPALPPPTPSLHSPPAPEPLDPMILRAIELGCEEEVVAFLYPEESRPPLADRARRYHLLRYGLPDEDIEPHSGPDPAWKVH